MNLEQFRRIQSRRNFLQNCAGGVGIFRVSGFIDCGGSDSRKHPSKRQSAGSKDPSLSSPRPNMSSSCSWKGGPSQFELFDEKPALQKYNGQSLPPSLTKDLNLAFIKPTAAVMASRYKFQPHGKSGVELSELLAPTRILRGRYLPGPFHAHGSL